VGSGVLEATALLLLLPELLLEPPRLLLGSPLTAALPEPAAEEAGEGLTEPLAEPLALAAGLPELQQELLLEGVTEVEAAALRDFTAELLPRPAETEGPAEELPCPKLLLLALELPRKAPLLLEQADTCAELLPEAEALGREPVGRLLREATSVLGAVPPAVRDWLRQPLRLLLPEAQAAADAVPAPSAAVRLPEGLPQAEALLLCAPALALPHAEELPVPCCCCLCPPTEDALLEALAAWALALPPAEEGLLELLMLRAAEGAVEALGRASVPLGWPEALCAPLRLLLPVRLLLPEAELLMLGEAELLAVLLLLPEAVPPPPAPAPAVTDAL
jgi:hypothetical protein